MHKVVIRAALAYVLAFCFLFPALAWADADTRPIVVLRVDDNPPGWRTPYPEFGGMSALEYGKLRHIPITWAIITSYASTNSGYITWAELSDYLDTAGGEAASHSVTHQVMANIQAYIDELVNSRAAINANLGPNYMCRTFIQPGVWTGDANLTLFSQLGAPIGQAIQANYDQSTAYIVNGWQVGSINYHYGLASTLGIDYSNGYSVQALLSMLDLVSQTPGLVFTIQGHNIQPKGGTAAGSVTSDMMSALMDKLAQLRDAGTVRLMGLNDAYHCSIPSNLNRFPNPNFDVDTSAMGNLGWPWVLGNNASNATISESKGINGSRCLFVTGSNPLVQSPTINVEPGRYVVSWYQRVEPGYPPNSPFEISVWNSGGTSPWIRIADCPMYTNTRPDAWEQKTALLEVKQGRGNLMLYLCSGSVSDATSGIRVDNISLINAPVDPATSPSHVAATPSPTGCTISWDTPSDPTVQSIMVRYNGITHPLTPSDGTLAGTLTAQPGSHQQIFVPLDWTQVTLHTYFSIFGIRANGFSGPDIDYVQKDTTSPTVAQVSALLKPDKSGIGAWTPSSTTNLYGYNFAVGTSPGTSNVVSWTATNSLIAIFQNLPLISSLYITVKAENLFGYWSSPVSTSFGYVDPSICSAKLQPDNTLVHIDSDFAVISAIFGSYYYVESPDRISGIKVLGTTSAHVGDHVTVDGTTTTLDGERTIIVNP